MAAPKKSDLKYFSVPLGFPYDPKFTKAEELIRKRGGSSMDCMIIDKIAIRLFSYIYRHGYYANWVEDIPSEIGSGLLSYNIFSENIQLIISALIDVDFINKNLFQQYGILTSLNIQEHWLLAQKHLRRVGRISEHLNLIPVVSSEETGVSSEETPVSSVNNSNGNIKKVHQPSEGMIVSSEETPVSSEGMVVSSEETPSKVYLSPNSSRSSIVNTISTNTTTSKKEKNEFEKNKISVGAGSNSPPGKETPYSAAPPLLDPILTPGGEFEPILLLELYFGLPRLQITRDRLSSIKHLDRQNNPNTLREWAEIYVDFLITHKSNKHKTLDDFVSHFANWLNMADTTQPPENFRKNNNIKHNSTNNGSKNTTTTNRKSNSSIGSQGF